MSVHANIDYPDLNVVSRLEWGALPPTEEFENLKTPCMSVRLWKCSNSRACKTKEECVKVVKEIQERDLKAGLGDIRFNFLVGEDGNAYEGRGYEKQPPKDPIMDEIWGRYIEIALIGDHRQTQISNRIFHVVAQLANAAVEKGALRFEANCLTEDVMP